jgi:hypothetical protein
MRPPFNPVAQVPTLAMHPKPGIGRRSNPAVGLAPTQRVWRDQARVSLRCCERHAVFCSCAARRAVLRERVRATRLTPRSANGWGESPGPTEPRGTAAGRQICLTKHAPLTP